MIIINQGIYTLWKSHNTFKIVANLYTHEYFKTVLPIYRHTHHTHTHIKYLDLVFNKFLEEQTYSGSHCFQQKGILCGEGSVILNIMLILKLGFVPVLTLLCSESRSILFFMLAVWHSKFSNCDRFLALFFFFLVMITSLWVLK